MDLLGRQNTLEDGIGFFLFTHALIDHALTDLLYDAVFPVTDLCSCLRRALVPQEDLRS